MADAKPIIIIKKSGGHGGHHGGAWEVASADFVTAMRALFIVFWLLNSSKQIPVAVGGYFKDPTGTSKQVGTNMQGSGEALALSRDDMPKLREELRKKVRQLDNFDKLKDHIEMTVTAEDLRIELMESEVGTFFESGSPTPTANGRELLITLARELGKLSNKISIEGHTDSEPSARDSSYGNWELSVDRANAARRLTQQDGLNADPVVQIRGHADQQLRKQDNPEDPSNRRISLIVQYTAKDASQERLRLDHLQIVGHAKCSGHAFRADAGSILVALVVHYSLERYVTALHNNADRLLHAQRVLLEAGKAVDGAIESPAQLVIHRRRRKDFDLVIHLFDTFDFLDDVFGVALQGWTRHLSE
jgi:chemotaxis protein MotB